MSVNKTGAYATSNTSSLSKRTMTSNSSTLLNEWVRNQVWPACNADSGSNKIVGLYAVWPGAGTNGADGGNFFAMTISGAYTINYGDGTTTNYAAGVTAYYEYQYDNAALAGTDGPVTFTDSGDLVTRTSHGYTNGTIVRFYNIVSTTGIIEAQPYYVINATTNTFQISATSGGSAVALTTNGSATLLPYKIATITITPQAANNLTNVNFFVKHNLTNLQPYSTGWLDIAIAGADITVLAISGASTTLNFAYLEKASINQLGNILSFSNLFNNCLSLQSVYIDPSISSVTDTSFMFRNCTKLPAVPLFNTASVTSMNSMFSFCYSLNTIPPFNTAAVTDMTSMLSSCTKLTTVPLFNTASATNMTSMFSGCVFLTEVPLFNTALVTSMSSMFNSCNNLTSVPALITTAVTSMSSMFSGCTRLTTVPLFNTALVTNMNNMFSSCYRLTNVPLFNTSSVTSMSSMFSFCYSLTTVPLFNTASVTNMSSMFNFCINLTTVPLFNTASVTNMSSMFGACNNLVRVPLFNTASVTNMSGMFSACNNMTSVPALVTTAVISGGFSSMFGTCRSLVRIQAKNFNFTFSVESCKLSATALNEIYTNLPTTTGQTITVTGNYGVASDNPAIATAKGWTVTG